MCFMKLGYRYSAMQAAEICNGIRNVVCGILNYIPIQLYTDTASLKQRHETWVWIKVPQRNTVRGLMSITYSVYQDFICFMTFIVYVLNTRLNLMCTRLFKINFMAYLLHLKGFWVLTKLCVFQALFWAVNKGRVDIVTQLINKKAKVNLRDRRGQTVIDLAHNKGLNQVHIIHYLNT